MSSLTWQENETEFLGKCPVCSSPHRFLKYKDIPDRVAQTSNVWDYHECNNCSVLYVDPRPTPETIERAYRSYFTHSVLEERPRKHRLDRVALGMRNDYLKWKFGHLNSPTLAAGRWLMYLVPPWLRLEWDYMARHLPQPSPERSRLLDVGCGNGDFMARAKTAGWEVTGIDLDPKAVATSRSRGLNTLLGDLASQGLPRESFDVVTLSHVLEHVHEPRHLLREIRKLLKSSGKLWLATPNTSSLVHLHFRQHWLDICAPQHLILFNASSLKGLLQEEGFGAIRYLPRGTHMQSHWRTSEALRRGRSGESVFVENFTGPKWKLHYWPLELIAYLFKTYQGDIVLCARKV
ncbi:MAG: methyltransferase domain-containing protein [Desulfacinum sp.]|nr:methyltransferase domain-containing protein [Desulfacinum sp.]